MARSNKTYNSIHKAAAVFLMVTLAWLTVSIPYIMSAQQKHQVNGKAVTAWNCNDCDDDCNDSSSNNVDEKAPSGPNLSEEFLHEHHLDHPQPVIIDYNHGHENCGIYIAYHGELHAPPPNLA